MKIEIMPTLRCNLSCEGCDRGVGHGPLLLHGDLEDFSIIDRLFQSGRSWFDGFVISGGEPTVYPELEKLIAHVRGLYDFPVDVKTNGHRLPQLSISCILNNHWSVSLYQENKKQFLAESVMWSHLRNAGVVDVSVIKYFDDLDSTGDAPTSGFDPVRHCLMPTIIGDSSKIFPCCRAFSIGHRRKKDYNIPVEKFSIQKMIEVIHDSDMCSGCPRMFPGERINK